jgi:selenocysteine lyase/cysteine desulfurase
MVSACDARPSRQLVLAFTREPEDTPKGLSNIVVAAVRADTIRLSVHLYNLEQEIDRVAEPIGGG